MNRYQIATLRAYYGQLLTERQNEVLRLRYDEDLSFGEIAENFCISRQAVLDAIKVGEKALIEYEDKLGIVAKTDRLKSLAQSIDVMILDGNATSAHEQIQNLIEILED